MTDQSEQQNIQASFDLTLKDSDLQNLGTDIAEIAIDSVLKDGALKDLPIVGTLVSLSKVGANVHDRLFLKKIVCFLNPLRDVSAENRRLMIKNIDESKKYRIKVGEKLLYIIDKSDDYEKSELIGIVFKYFIEGNIEYDEFLEVASALNNLTIKDFKWFIKYKKYFNFSLDDIGSLIGSGLFNLHYEQIDVRVSEQEDHKFITNPHPDKYKADVEGGGVDADISRAGEIILEIFCKEYKKTKAIK